MSAIVRHIPIPPALATLDKARLLLSEARTLPEVKRIRDLAEAAKVYARAAHLSRESQNYAAEISLLASRKAGEILCKLEKSAGGHPKRKTPDILSPVSEYRKVLKETDTSERKAQRWQELAKISNATVKNYIEESKTNTDDEISASGLLKSAKKDAAKKNPKPIIAPAQPKCTASCITARITVLLSEFSALNAFTKQLKFAELDGPSKDEVRTLIALLRKVSKDAAERADRLQKATAA
jgi:uncharacterized Zn finger protein (UPF0148 family)